MKQKFNPLLVAISEGINIPLEKPIVLIGRHQECDIQIPSTKISRRHCCIALVNDHLVIRDLGSTNGIRINGLKVVEGNLQAGDEVTIGNACYKVRLGGEADANGRGGPALGIKAGAPPMQPAAGHDQSYEMPMPLPDLAIPHSAAPSKPPHLPLSPVEHDSRASEPDLTVKPGVFDPSDEIGLAPLVPPK